MITIVQLEKGRIDKVVNIYKKNVTPSSSFLGDPTFFLPLIHQRAFHGGIPTPLPL